MGGGPQAAFRRARFGSGGGVVRRIVEVRVMTDTPGLEHFEIDASAMQTRRRPLFGCAAIIRAVCLLCSGYHLLCGLRSCPAAGLFQCIKRERSYPPMHSREALQQAYVDT